MQPAVFLMLVLSKEQKCSSSTQLFQDIEELHAWFAALWNAAEWWRTLANAYEHLHM